MGGGNGGSSGGNDSTTVTNTSEPPEYVKGPATRYLQRAEGLSRTPFSAYQGERVAGLTPQHYQGIDQASNAYRPEPFDHIQSYIGVMLIHCIKRARR